MTKGKINDFEVCTNLEDLTNVLLFLNAVMVLKVPVERYLLMHGWSLMLNWLMLTDNSVLGSGIVTLVSRYA